jgi:hypothetical protein
MKVILEMCSGDLKKKKKMFLYEYRLKFSCAPTLLATYCTIIKLFPNYGKKSALNSKNFIKIKKVNVTF